MMSSALTEAESPPAAPRAGADLRAARERLGWTIEDVAAALRIRQPHLEALEDGRIDLLPGNAYALGFLRTYAKTLGLDPDEIVRRFKSEASEVNQRTELVFPAPMPERGLPAGAVILLGVVLAIGAYAGWYRLSGQGRLPSETVAPIPHHLASLADQGVPPAATRPDTPDSARTRFGAKAGGPSSLGNGAATQSYANAGEPVAGETPQTVATPNPHVKPSVTTASSGQGPVVASASAAASAAGQQNVIPPAPTISPTSAAAASVPLAMAAPAAPTAAPTAAAPAASTRDPSQIVLKATADAWMQVRDRDGGDVLLSRVLHTGDTWTVPQRPDLVLTTGNAGGTEVMVGGVTVQVPGGSGAVRRDLPLDPSAIKDGFAQLTPLTVPGGGSAAPHAAQSSASASAGR